MRFLSGSTLFTSTLTLQSYTFSLEPKQKYGIQIASNIICRFMVAFGKIKGTTHE